MSIISHEFSLTTSPFTVWRQFVLFFAGAGFGIATLLLPFSFGIFNMGVTIYGVSLVYLCASLFLIPALYPNSQRFLFSTGFWLLITIIFYIVLKSIGMWIDGDVTDNLIHVLWLTTCFTIFFCIAFAWTNQSVLRNKSSYSREPVIISMGGEWILLLIYIGFKIISIFLYAKYVGSTYLETSSETQNAGASYIFNIPKVANVILLGLLLNCFKNRRGYVATSVGLALYLSESILLTNRFAIVILVLWAIFLYHRYRNPVSILALCLLSAPLIIVVVLLGYARSLGLGSFFGYMEAIEVIIDDPTIILNLFMSRMDMLPQMVMGLDLYESGIIESLNGASYIYAFLHAIPRNIWETKPLLTSALLTAETHPGGFGDGVLLFPSLIIESVLNLYYVGPVLMGIFVGVLSRHFERAVYSQHLAPSLWGVSALTFPMTMFNEGIHSNFTGQFIFSTAIMFLLYKGMLFFGVLKRQRTF